MDTRHAGTPDDLRRSYAAFNRRVATCSGCGVTLPVWQWYAQTLPDGTRSTGSQPCPSTGNGWHALRVVAAD